MPDTPPATRTELLTALEESGRVALTRLRALPAARFAEGAYENGWSGRELLAHIAAIEWTYPRLLSLPTEGRTGATDGAVQGGIDTYNARQVAKRSDVPAPELIAEFERNRAATIRAVAAADEAAFAVPVRSAGGREGTLLQVFYEVAVGHMLGHLADLTGGESRRAGR